jgi:hypothetical protein
VSATLVAHDPAGVLRTAATISNPGGLVIDRTTGWMYVVSGDVIYRVNTTTGNTTLWADYTTSCGGMQGLTIDQSTGECQSMVLLQYPRHFACWV